MEIETSELPETNAATQERMSGGSVQWYSVIGHQGPNLG